WKCRTKPRTKRARPASTAFPRRICACISTMCWSRRIINLMPKDRMKNAVIAGLVSLSLFHAHAKDWPQWGGDQHRNMYSDEKGLPDRVEPGKLKKGTEEVDMATTKNVKWVAKLGSQSYGNS